MTRVCAVVTGIDAAAMRDRAETALAAGLDLVELRLDSLLTLTPEAVAHLGRVLGPRAIASLRPDGSPLPDGVLEAVCRAGFRYIDVDAGFGPAILSRTRALAHTFGSELVVSRHLESMPSREDLRSRADEVRALADIVKIAAPARRAIEAVRVVAEARALRAEGRRACLLATGEAGRLTRALAADLGSEFQYVPPPGAAGSALGQLDLDTARRLLAKDRYLLGIVGHPLDRTLSPAMHNAALAKLRVPAAYFPLPVSPGELPAFLAAATSLRIRGLNVTMPHKTLALRAAKVLDADAQATAAVNTLVFAGGEVHGYNTDVHGFSEALREERVSLGGEALVIGAGGAARAVVHVLRQMGCRVGVANRTPARAQELAREFRVEGVRPGDLSDRSFDLVVNCTPVDSPTESPVPETAFSEGGVAVDLTCPPHLTAFLRAARARGAAAVDGRPMLLHQGARAFALFTGRDPPLEAMREALEAVP